MIIITSERVEKEIDMIINMLCKWQIANSKYGSYG